jgi:integrase
LPKFVHAHKRSAWRDEYSVAHPSEFFNGRVLNGLKRRDVRGYIDFRKTNGALLQNAGRRRTSQAANQPLDDQPGIGPIFGSHQLCWVEWEWDIPNPTLGVSLPEPEGRLRYLSKEEYAALLDVAKASKKTPHLADFIRLAVHTGMREHEMLDLLSTGPAVRYSQNRAGRSPLQHAIRQPN